MGLKDFFAVVGVNPFIYIAKYADFQHQLHRLLYKMFCPARLTKIRGSGADDSSTGATYIGNHIQRTKISLITVQSVGHK